jgi:hypothetical protein
MRRLAVRVEVVEGRLASAEGLKFEIFQKVHRI